MINTDWRIAEPTVPFEHVSVEADPGGPGSKLSPEMRSRLVVDTVHDGDLLPVRLFDIPKFAARVESGTLMRDFIRERDWGADLVARHLSRSLGIGGYYRVTIARVIVDFNRFPGVSTPDLGPLDRLAISPDLAPCLQNEHKRYVLEQCYDPVSVGMEQAIFEKLIKISIHTYDERNPSLTVRPMVSLLSRSHSYQQKSHLPYGLFDPMFPDVLASNCSKRILRDRIALTLEKAGIHVEHNYPYCLPDGSLEMRCQPWFFFHYLRQNFERENPDTTDDAAFAMVWSMLFNTNLRGSDGAALSGYLHRFLKAPRDLSGKFDAARIAYEHIDEYLNKNWNLVERYRNSANRTSALAIEVRKDLLVDFEDGIPVRTHDEQAKEIAETIADAIRIYLQDDRKGTEQEAKE